MKKIKFIVLSLLLFNIYGCNSVQKAFVPQKRNTGEEFLVKKKSPLVIPPNFYDLPIPKTNQEIFNQNKKNIQSLISNNDNIINDEPKDNKISKNLEEIILKKITNK